MARTDPQPTPTTGAPAFAPASSGGSRRPQALVQQLQEARARAGRASACPVCRDSGPCSSCPRGFAFGRAEDEREVRRATRALLGAAGLPPRLNGYTLATYRAIARADQTAAASVAALLTREEPSGLILCGPNGVGKSGLAAAYCRALAPRLAASPHADLCWLSAGELLDRLAGPYLDSEQAALLERAKAAALLVLDDLDKADTRSDAAGRVAGDRRTQVLWRIVDRRYQERRPIVATLTLPLDADDPAPAVLALERLLGRDMVDRLLDGVPVIGVRGDNLRAQEETA